MRIDRYLAERFSSRTKAADAIEGGFVLVNGKRVCPSYEVRPDDDITFIESNAFVSRGGNKLQKAIDDFGYSAEGKVFADVGASNGGFTDCLMRHGAKKVYCIDVGESQLDESLLKDYGERIVVFDNCNARNLTAEMFDERPDGAVIDVSFISLTYILGAVAGAIGDGGEIIALIKPQFECDSRNVGKNGIVKGADKHKAIILKIYDFCLSIGLNPQKLTTAPIVKGKNTEYLILLKKGGGEYIQFNQLIKYAKL